jgi:hypothetical protein
VYELAKLVKAFSFLSSFYHYEEPIEQLVLFAHEIYEDKYTDDGAIFDMMAHSILVYGLSQSVY